MALRLLTNLPELSQADNANDFSITSLKSPSRIGEWLALLKAMKQPTLFIEYFRCTEGYTQHYGIPAEKFSYVPFKVNGLEMIQ